MRRALAVICVVAGCSSFEDPSIVIDLRVLAMHADVPEQVFDVDLEMPMPAQLLERLRETTVTALVADPGVVRPLRWSMTLCLVDDEGRCDLTKPYADLGSGVIDDPDTAPVPQIPRATVLPTAHGQTLLAMVYEALEANPVEALGGINYTVMLQIGGVDDDPANDVYAAKNLRIAARIPSDRRPNTNPYVDFLDAAETGISITIPRTRCAEVSEFELAVPVVDAGSVITLFPIEPAAVRENYTAPTLTGGTVSLQETITYQWLGAYGSFADEFTGGGHDVLGNQSLLGTDWRAPNLSGGDLLVPIWMIQRDERLGVVWLETCIRVVP